MIRLIQFFLFPLNGFHVHKIVQVVGESGLFTPADIAYVQAAGVKAVSKNDY